MKRAERRNDDQLLTESPDQLPQLLLHLGTQAFAFFGTVANELDLPPPVAMALRRIEPARPGPMNELAGAMGCDPSFVTWIADQLEERGLAERQLSSQDRRVKVLALTPAGIALRDQLLDRLTRFPVAIDRLSAGEAAMLSELLARMLSDDAAAAAPECGVVVVGPGAAGERRQPRTKRRSVAAKG